MKTDKLLKEIEFFGINSTKLEDECKSLQKTLKTVSKILKEKEKELEFVNSELNKRLEKIRTEK